MSLSSPRWWPASCRSFRPACCRSFPANLFISGVSFEEMKAAGAVAVRSPANADHVARLRPGLLARVHRWARARRPSATDRAPESLLERIAGVVVIIFGLHLAGSDDQVARPGQARADVARPAGPFGALLVGIAFAFGWTPCIGPILGGILAVAGSETSAKAWACSPSIRRPRRSVPADVARHRSLLRRLHDSQYYKPIEIASGVLIVVLGVLIFTNRFTILSNYFSKFLPTF